MKIPGIKTLMVGMLWCAAPHPGFSQDFVNLDFESAVIVPDPSGPIDVYAVNASDALPGWTVTGGLLPRTGDIVYNDRLSEPSVAIFGANGYNSGVYPVLAGEFSVDLESGEVPTAEVSISQTGFVPANTASIQFMARGVSPLLGGSRLLVSLGGQSISFSALSTGPNYTVYGGNIPFGLAGQSEQLTFAAPGGPDYLGGSNEGWELDDIQFSATAVPEPISSGVFALAGLFIAWRHRRGALP